MRDIEKLNNRGSTKAGNTKEHIKLKVDSPRFKRSSTKSQGKNRKLKSKSRKLRGSTNALAKTAIDSSVKAPNKNSSNKRLIIRQSLHKTDRNSKQVQPKINIQGGKNSPNNDRESEKDIDQETNIQKRKRRRKKKRERLNVEIDDTSRLQRRTRNLLIRMKLEQNLIDAYSGEGWKGQSREKIRPEKELQRAKKQIIKCKLSIRDAIRQLDSLSSVGSIEGSVIATDGSVYHEHIFCAICKMREAFPDNDIILCDGTCNRAFHQRCLDPPLDTENIPPGDQGWFCKFCECKTEILEATNAHLGTRFSLDSTWQDVFKEEAAIPDGDTGLLNQEEEWPSDDPEDDDYNPDMKEDSHGGNNTDGNDDNASDDSSSSGSMWSLNGECSLLDEGLEYYSVSHGCIDSDESGEIACGRRQRTAVDYLKLYDEMFGKDAQYEQLSEDEDWGPVKRPRTAKESDAVNTLMALHEIENKHQNNENKHPNNENNGRIRGNSAGIKRPCFRIPHDAVEKLRQAFAENELPPKSVKDALSKELGLDAAKVNKWFKNARYSALKTRKYREGGKQLQSFTSKTSKDCTSQQVQEDEILKPKVKKITVIRSVKKCESVTGKEKSKASSSLLKKKKPEIPPPLREKNGNKDLTEDNGDVSLMKLLKERKRKVSFAFEGDSKEAELELERLTKLKMKVDRLKQRLTQVQNYRSKGSEDVVCLNEPSIMYVPVAELREKVK